jgi:hypothetical protein
MYAGRMSQAPAIRQEVSTRKQLVRMRCRAMILLQYDTGVVPARPQVPPPGAEHDSYREARNR